MPTAKTQYILQLIQVFFVGLTLGMTRTVVPAVAESDFGVRSGALELIATFIIAFGLVKGAMNFIAGALSESLGRKRVLVAGWLIALPIPWMIWYAPTEGGWNWIVAATVLLGINQGLTWSMTLTSKLDLTRSARRGLTNGLNEFFGYFAVAVAGVITGYLSHRLGARLGLLIFGLASIIPALLMALLLVRESREASSSSDEGNMRTLHVVTLSFRDRDFFALCQAGLVEKFIDVLMWLVLPVYLTAQGIDLKSIGWIPGIYYTTWGCLQLVTGPLSDRLGRPPLIVGGMLVCAVAVELFPMNEGATWWSSCAALAGIGMAMLYPTLGAAVSDFAPAPWRGTALGVYRCWRDLGYAIGAGLLCVPVMSGRGIGPCFGLAATCVAVSAVVTSILYLSGGSRPPVDNSGGDGRKSL